MKYKGKLDNYVNKLMKNNKLQENDLIGKRFFSIK